jgi:uncharacterized protein
MKRFDENMTLDHLADRGELDSKLSARLAVAIAAMHERADPVDTTAWLAAVESFVIENTAAFKTHGDLFPRQSIAQLELNSQAAFARLLPLLMVRGGQGLIRRGHGDLHLGNIAVLNGEPVAFDALEFDPVIASCDVLYDLAFLLMDLVERGLKRTANGVLNEYFSATRRIEDCDGIAALPFFMSLRAAIRAKVTAARLETAAAGDRPEIVRSAKLYFELALELLSPAKPIVVCTGGLSGTGKSVLAYSLAPLLAPIPGALVFRSDVERKALYKVTENDRLSPDAYRPEVSEKIYRILNDKTARVARAGHSVVVDAVFAKPDERVAIETVAAEAGVGFRGLILTTGLQTRLNRIGKRGPDASDADADVARKQEEFAIGSLTWNIVDASGSAEETLDKARVALKPRS